jgi:hypothetical protein
VRTVDCLVDCKLKFCVQCIWCSSVRGGFLWHKVFYRCAHPKFADPVTGEAYESCYELRSRFRPNWCGETGQFFQSKQQARDDPDDDDQSNT